MLCQDLDDRTRAILLLTADMGDLGGGKHRPLTAVEWGRLALWMRDCGEAPERLLDYPDEKLARVLTGAPFNAARLRGLFARSELLRNTLAEWERSGIWLLTRGRVEYPKLLKDRMGNQVPPILYGIGCIKRLSAGGVAVVGSRNADPVELNFASRIGAFLGANKLSVVSGGARGVDERSMFGSIERGGPSVGVIGGGFLDKLKLARYHEAVTSDLLTLVTPYAPEITPLPRPQFVARLMGRNRFIYGLSDAAIIVASEYDKGGTWAGATAALNDKWLPIWCFPSKKPSSGFAPLLKRGALALTPDIEELITRMPPSVADTDSATSPNPLMSALTRGSPIELHVASP